MSGISSKRWAKVCGIILTFVTGCVFLLSFILLMIAGECGVFSAKNPTEFRDNLFEGIINQQFYLRNSYYYQDSGVEGTGDVDSSRGILYNLNSSAMSNLRYQVTDKNGNVIGGDYNGEMYFWERKYYCLWGGYGIETPDRDLYLLPYTSAGDVLRLADVSVTLQHPMKQHDLFYYFDKIYIPLYDGREALIVVCAVSLVMTIALTIFLCFCAGKKQGVEGIYLNNLNRIPFDLMLALYLTVIVPPLAIVATEVRANTIIRFTEQMSDEFLVACLSLALIFVYAVGMSCLMNCCARLKVKGWWKNTLVYKILYFIWKRVLQFFWRLIVRAAKAIAHLFKQIPSIWQGVLILGAVMGIEFLMAVTLYYDPDAIIVWLLFNALVCGALVVMMILHKRLEQGAQQLAHGNSTYKIDTKFMILSFKTHAENLNNIGGGIVKAVEERTRSERFKTELITNVSHDLKTPLTSIISYIDLLKKEDLKSKKADEYVEVLARQSSRLKKLTDDLLEASKASTGNVDITLEQCDLGVMFTQAIGEYTEKFTEQDLQLIENRDEQSVFINADLKHMWRIFDNLLSNIVKYSLKNSRVYLSLENHEGIATVTMRNISEHPLNNRGDELAHRFVRGDSSRSTDGSGLGLSIARSLTEAQGGKMKITTDGDLFKVEMSFPTIKRQAGDPVNSSPEPSLLEKEDEGIISENLPQTV